MRQTARFLQAFPGACQIALIDLRITEIQQGLADVVGIVHFAQDSQRLFVLAERLSALALQCQRLRQCCLT